MGVGSPLQRSLNEDVKAFFDGNENLTRLVTHVNNSNINRIPILDSTHLTNISVTASDDLLDVDSVFTFTFNSFVHTHLEPSDQDLLKNAIEEFISQEFNISVERLSIVITSGSSVVDITVSKEGTEAEQADEEDTRYRAWQQIGASIEGSSEGGNEQTGWDIKLNNDGNRIIIGSVGFAFGTKGVVRVYDLQDENWIQKGNDIKGGVFYMQGFSVCCNKDGSIIVIGSPGGAAGDAGSGIAQAFHLVDDEWQQLGNDIQGETFNEWVGSSVSMDYTGEIIAIGARNFDLNGSTSVGYVRVFRLEDDEWKQIGSDIVGEAQDDKLGACVKLNSTGELLFLSIPGKNSNDGSVVCYMFNGSDWIQMGDPINGENGETCGDQFDINKDGDIVAIGCPLHDEENEDDIGRAKVFKWNGIEWTNYGNTIIGQKKNVSLNDDGSILVIGTNANGPDPDAAARGSARVFRIEDDEWKQIGSDIVAERNNETLGHGLSLNRDGNILGTGAYLFQNEDGFNVGKTRIHRLLTLDSKFTS